MEWFDWSACRPDKRGLYWFRLPEAVYGGVKLRPEWVCEVTLVGMGYAPNALWPLFSNWDGYRRTIPEGLQWARATEPCGDSDYRLPGIELRLCPFCGSPPKLTAEDVPAGGGCRLYHTAFRPNRFRVGCTCLPFQTGWLSDLTKLITLWNGRQAEANLRSALDGVLSVRTLLEAKTIAENILLEVKS